MIRIRTLGALSANRDGQPTSGAAIQPRRLALLALVARAGDRGVTREQLLAILWPDADEGAGRRALSQALHALRADLDDELFLGVQELKLNGDVASSDIGDFESGIADRSWERAADAYAGPFLDGFRLAGAPEFERWMEDERSQLAHRQAEVLERLARMSAERGDAPAAVRWWRRRAAMDALNARVTLELMRALADLGERHAALQQARIYEALVEQELGLPPDEEVARYAEQLRRAPAPRTPPPPAVASYATPVVELLEQLPPRAIQESSSVVVSSRPGRSVRARLAIGAAALIMIGALGAALWLQKTPKSVPLLAVGAIADYRGASGTEPLTDMLATNLARIPGLQVTSTVRLLELIERTGKSPDAAAFAAAARQAGATDLLEGGLHATRDGLVLELRRVSLVTGRVVTAWQVEGKDYFALVDRATSEFATSVGFKTASVPGKPSTQSLVAWRFYEEGLRHFARGDYRGAQGLFESALVEDSTFAMAAYQLLRTRWTLDLGADSTQLARLTRLARETNDRDRLQILGWAAFAARSPALDALADTLIIRHPADIESQYLAGFARMARADFGAALPYLHRVIAADSVGIARHGVRCLACDALQLLVYAYLALDSIPRAHQVALDWTKSDPQSKAAWASLGSMLDVLGRDEEAIGARRRANPFDASDNIFAPAVKLRAGDFATADQMARALMADGGDDESNWQGFWIIATSLRYQARWRELDVLTRRRFATASAADRVGVNGRQLRVTEAVANLEAGRPADAVRILDSLARSIDPRIPIGERARVLTLQYALLAEAALVMGNAALVARAADSADAWAHRNNIIREAAIALHARALHQLAGHDTVAAIRTLEQAMFSRTMGYTRSNLLLARLLLRRGDARRAADLLRAALRGSLGSSNFYVTHTELHETLGDAYASLGKADSARASWNWVSVALAHADSAAKPRYLSAINHLGGVRVADFDSSARRNGTPAATAAPRTKRQ
jgi:DNA-binding SARP family transcriptional activator